MIATNHLVRIWCMQKLTKSAVYSLMYADPDIRRKFKYRPHTPLQLHFYLSSPSNHTPRHIIARLRNGTYDST